MILDIVIGLIKTGHQIFTMLVVASLGAILFVNKKMKKEIKTTAIRVFAISIILTIILTVVIFKIGGAV